MKDLNCTEIYKTIEAILKSVKPLDSMSMNQIVNDFKMIHQQNIPFEKFDFSNLNEFLHANDGFECFTNDANDIEQMIRLKEKNVKNSIENLPDNYLLNVRERRFIEAPRSRKEFVKMPAVNRQIKNVSGGPYATTNRTWKRDVEHHALQINRPKVKGYFEPINATHRDTLPVYECRSEVEELTLVYLISLCINQTTSNNYLDVENLFEQTNQNSLPANWLNLLETHALTVDIDKHTLYLLKNSKSGQNTDETDSGFVTPVTPIANENIWNLNAKPWTLSGATNHFTNGRKEDEMKEAKDLNLFDFLPWNESRWDLLVTNVCSLNCIWAQIVLSEVKIKFNTIMNKVISNPIFHPAKVEVGGIYLAHIENMWQRVRIDSRNSTYCFIFPIDIGGEKLWLPIAQIFTCNVDFTQLPGQAIRFSLFGLSHLVAHKLPQQQELIQQHLKNKVISAAVQTKQSEMKDAIEIIVYDTLAGVNVNAVMLKQLYEYNPKSLFRWNGLYSMDIVAVNEDGGIFGHLKDTKLPYDTNLMVSIILGLVKNDDNLIQIMGHRMKSVSDDGILVYLANVPVLSEELIITLRSKLRPNNVVCVRFVEFDASYRLLVNIFVRNKTQHSMYSLNNLMGRLQKATDGNKEVADEEIIELNSDDDESQGSSPSSPPPPLISMNSIPEATIIPMGLKIRVTVTTVYGPRNFYIRCRADEDEILSELTNNLQGYCRAYKKFLTDEIPLVNNAYAARNDLDGLWYRVTVAKIVSKDMVKIQFCDLGSMTSVQIGKLKPLPFNFRCIPKLAIPAQFYGTEFKMENWSYENGIIFRREYHGNEFIACVKERRVCNGVCTLAVELTKV